MFWRRKKRNLLTAVIIVSFLGSIIFIAISTKINTTSTVLRKQSSDSSNFTSLSETSPYLPAQDVNPLIFIMNRFSQGVLKEHGKQEKNWCPIPARLRRLTDRLCHLVNQHNCTKFPCSMLYSKKRETITCLPGGRNSTGNTNATEQLECLTGETLDFFLDDTSYPSLSVNRYPLSDSLFTQTLSRYYRSPRSVWGFQFSDESFTYYPWAADRNLLRLFNLTLGYNRNFYHMLGPVYLPVYVPKLSTERTSLATVLRDKVEAPSYVKAPILYINANCNPPSKRGHYMKELMQYIAVDAWGACDRNRKENEIPEEILKIHKIKWNSFHYDGNWKASKMAMAKSYLFTVAIENSINSDYVTEKLWQPLAAGSVPLYLGAPNIDDWLPCNNCIIDLRKFSGPQELAKLLLDLSKNQTRYAEYHRWREEPISRNFQNRLNYFARLSNYSVECMLCDIAHSRNQSAARARILAELAYNPQKNYL